MNPFVKIVLLTVCSAGILYGEGNPALLRLPLPDSISAFKTSPQEKKEFLSLLHEKELPDCYREVRKKLGAFSSKGAGDVNAEDVRVLSWIFYVVASADTFPWDYDENTPKDGLYDNMDYELKTRVVRWMNSLALDISEIVTRCRVKRKDLTGIWSEYGAAVLKTFREGYDPELNRKQAKMKEEYDKMSAERTWRLVQERKLSLFGGAEPRSIYYNNKLLSNENRNSSCKYDLEKMLEPAFVEMLVRFYPGQAGEVVKYLKKAGYADKEIGDLIDRTVGRDGRTEFLYKGDRGRQHNKKVKSRGSGRLE
ncbi:hypothetical protein [Akkermansia sp.]|uniref:hypothetical protein n=1 Tax=Akkermansia sp. TaxID=1872421 RepID=UPI0025C49D14|nr:hypothetical protein [Akkermansia sp.]MCC8148348.1 hypothetical protein [Akkermansia sp.]